MNTRNRHKQAGTPAINLGLIITPMLDMSFQILAFFIMTYHPSALEGHIPGSLVPSDNIATKGKENNPNPAEVPLSVDEATLLPELNEAIQVKIKAVIRGQEFGKNLEGMMGQLYIKQAADTQHTMLADVNVSQAEKLQILEAKLKDLIRQGVTKKANLKIEADNELRQQYVMKVYDTCKKCGFDKIHFVPPPILNSKLKAN